MSSDDKLGDKAEEVKGKAKKAYGDATDDSSMQAEGQSEKSKADLKQAGKKAKDAFK